MKRLALAVVLMGLSGCAVGKDTGTALCTAQDELAGVLDQAGTLLGTPGEITAGFLNMGTDLFCTVFAAAISAPADLGDQLGITDSEEGEPDVAPEDSPGN